MKSVCVSSNDRLQSVSDWMWLISSGQSEYIQANAATMAQKSNLPTRRRVSSSEWEEMKEKVVKGVVRGHFISSQSDLIAVSVTRPSAYNSNSQFVGGNRCPKRGDQSCLHSFSSSPSQLSTSISDETERENGSSLSSPSSSFWSFKWKCSSRRVSSSW